MLGPGSRRLLCAYDRNLAETGVEVSVTADKLMQPPRLGNFKVNVVCPVSLTEDQNAGSCAQYIAASSTTRCWRRLRS